MKKMVDGKIVDMAPEEIARRQAEDAAFEAELANPQPRPKTLEERLAAAEAEIAVLKARQ